MRMKLGLVSLQVIALSTFASPAFAQTSAGGSAANPPASDDAQISAFSDISDISDIIVTARRRQETSLQTPVVLSAFSGEQLARFNVNSLIDVAKLTPQLALGTANGSYGGVIALRGVSSPTSNPGQEGAVTVNLDGVPVSYGSIIRISTFDIGQVEILKGPQALFFGKNSSGGIIAIRSAEPTTSFKAQVSGGYEFNARQADLDGYVSGPLGDTITARISGRFSRQRGYFINTAPNPASRFAPGTDEEAVRLGLNWTPNDQWTVKLRGTYHHVRENGGYGINQKFVCASGVPNPASPAVLASDRDCVADKYLTVAAIPSAIITQVTGSPYFDSDTSYYKATQILLSGDVEYRINDFLTFNSVTGYYTIRQNALDSVAQGGNFFIADQGRLRKSTASQEFRLSYRNPDVPLNLMLGGFFQDDHHNFEQQIIVSTSRSGPPQIAPVVPGASTPIWYVPTHNTTYSVFGQVGWDVTTAVSFSAGVRYTQDKKRENIAPPNGLPNKISRPRRNFSNWSPELTLSYRPSPLFNLFGSYKQGFKAGAFNIAAPSLTAPTINPGVTSFDNSYEPETAAGFEVGLKALLLDRQLRLNLAAYSYLYKDLQVSRVDPATIVLSVLNASSARIKGLEGDFNFSPHAVPGLTLNGSAAYNSAKYASSFQGPCYPGQTPANGCFFNGVSNVQEFRGRTLHRAPTFSGGAGVSYEMPISGDWNATFNANGVYTSGQYLSQELSPIGRTPGRFLLDSSLSFGPKSKSMEFAIIGRNLTNKHFLVTASPSPGTGSGTGTAAGRLPDYEGPVSRGREIWLKVTLRPSEF